MQTKVVKWGNRLAIRIPLSVVAEVGLKAQDDLEIEVEDGCVVLKPHVRHNYRLNDLVKRINRYNVHHEVLSHTPIGREIW